MSLCRVGFFINLVLLLAALSGCLKPNETVWLQINNYKGLKEKSNIIVCGISNSDCVMCYSSLKSKLISLCNQYHVSKDSILFVTPELRKVEIEYLFKHNLKFEKEPEQKIVSTELFDFLKKEVAAETGLNYFIVLNAEKKVVEKGVFHLSE